MAWQNQSFMKQVCENAGFGNKNIENNRNTHDLIFLTVLKYFLEFKDRICFVKKNNYGWVGSLTSVIAPTVKEYRNLIAPVIFPILYIFYEKISVNRRSISLYGEWYLKISIFSAQIVYISIAIK